MGNAGSFFQSGVWIANFKGGEMVEVRIALSRPTTKSNLEFIMKAREKCLDYIPEYISEIYPDWVLHSIRVQFQV